MGSRADEFAAAMEAARAAQGVDRPAFRRWPLVCETTDDGLLAVSLGNRGKTHVLSREDALAWRDWLTETYEERATRGGEPPFCVEPRPYAKPRGGWPVIPLPGVRPMQAKP